MQIEIIGRGPSKTKPHADSKELWWMSTARGGVPSTSEKDMVWNIHAPKLIEPWLYKCPRHMTADMLPVSNIIKQFGPVFASTVSWMIGYALIYRPAVTTILLNGVDLLRPSERLQMESLAYLAGYAHAKGVDVRHATNAKMFGYGRYCQ